MIRGCQVVGKIFLNYRRGDDAGSVGRLFDRLEQAFGRDVIFMDVEGHIKAGDDYVDVLRDQVAECDVLLAVIGPRWLTLADETGRRRLDNPDDWVRVEIVSALEAAPKKRVVPVLVPGGEMPRAEDLPVPLQPLARRQAVRVTLERFNADAQGLISQVKAVLDDIARQNAPSDADRAAAEKELRGREVSENARLAAVEERGREQRASGMSADDVRKAEELASWDFIKTRKDLEELRDHLARFPGGATERYAQARLAELTYAGLSASSSIEALRAYVVAFPKSDQIAQVQSWLNIAEGSLRMKAAEKERRARETADWADVAAATDPKALETYLKKWPRGIYTSDAKERLKEVRRNLLLKQLCYGACGAAAVGVLAFVTLIPGMPVWRSINDQSQRTFSGDGAEFAAIASNGSAFSASHRTFKIWDLAKGRELRGFTGPWVTSVAIAPDGKTALSGTYDNTVNLWELASGRELRRLVGHSDAVRSVAFAPDGKTAISGGNDGKLKLWDLAEGRELRALTGHSSWVDSVAVTPDGKIGISADSNNIKLWDLTSGRELRSFVDNGWKASIAITPDGRRALIANYKEIKILDLTSGQETGTFTGHNDRVRSIVISSDGKKVLSGSNDRTIRLWDLATGQLLRTFVGHSEQVTSVAIGSDGRSAFSASGDGTFKVWDLDR